MKNGVIPLEVKGTVKTVINGKRRRTVEEHEKYVDVRNACYRKRSEKNKSINYFTGFDDGAEFGYNKANEWQFVSEKGLPKESGRYLVYVGGGEKGVYPLDFETEYNDFGYWCLIINSASLGVTDTVFEIITERNEDKVIAWKEIVLPKEEL